MKNVVITGSTRGVGLCMAREFLQAGCSVTLSGRGAVPPDGVAQSLRGFEGRYAYTPCNVRIPEDIEALWQKAEALFGPVDIWINNAGANFPHEFSYNAQASYVDAVVDTNIKGMMHGSLIAVRHMLMQGFGQIWNMEGLGSNNMIQPKTIVYGASKHALTYFTRGLARELKGTPVMAGRLSPGMMLTDFMTKGPDGAESSVIHDKNFRFVFNALADHPETVAAFFVPLILANRKNDAHLVWLTNSKTMVRFMKVPFSRRKLI
jgi:NAD(P)-dependent dehydrogenase (short-subunit alcohol dehydrogenase family)